jgi:hypothetical protein
VTFYSIFLLVIFLGPCNQTFGQSVPPGAPAPRSGSDTPVVIMSIPPTKPDPAPKRSVDALELQREAKQILELSQSIQPDIEKVNQGVLPKDTIEKLKRIEKLSKHLRGQIDK